MAGAGLFGMGLQAVGTLLGGISESRSYRASARVDEENARLTLLQGEMDASQSRHDERMATGDMLAGQATSGLVMGSGSLADMVRQNAYQRELEILNIRTRAVGEANQLYQSAADKRRAAKSAIVNSVFSVVSSAVTGISGAIGQNRMAAQGAIEKASSYGGGMKNVPAMRVKGPMG